MHFRYAFFSTLILMSSAAAAANVSIVALLSEIPTCAFPCIALEGSAAALLADPASSCRNVTRQAILSACIQTHCNYTEQVQVGYVNDQLCEGIPFESRSLQVSITAIVFVAAALICVGLRLYSRWSITRRFGYDDWIIITTAVLLVAECGLDLDNTFGNGYGRHYWNIDPAKIELLLKTFYIAEMLYVAILTLVKVSILLFYLRVFENTPWFRFAALLTLGLVITSGVGIIFTIMFQCAPIKAIWDRTVAAKCLDTNKLIYASAGVGIALDVIILILPIPELINLQMNMRKKLNVLFMFSIGGFSCITSIVRLKYVVSFGASTDQTWDNALPALWSMIEICVATICACLPSMRALFSRWLPYLFDINTHISSNYRNKSNPSSSNNNHVRLASDTVGRKTNKRIINSPDDDLLKTFHDKAEKDNTEVKVWINPKFDDKGNMIGMGELSPASNSPAVSASTGPLFTLQGPRKSDEISILAEGEGIAMRDLKTGKGKERNAQRVDTVVREQVTVQEVAKELPPLPSEAYHWTWSGAKDDDYKRYRSESAPSRPPGTIL